MIQGKHACENGEKDGNLFIDIDKTVDIFKSDNMLEC
jgi:hypothetical protein